MEYSVSKNLNKKNNFYSCKLCDYNTSFKRDYEKHIVTKKHMKQIETKKYICDHCGKEMKSRTTIWRHQKVCGFGFESPNIEIIVHENENMDVEKLTNLVLDVVKQNQELTNQIVELSKHSPNNMASSNSTTNYYNNNNTNTINNKFNLQFFLNEKCKDALNISDFVDSLKITLHDLENLGSDGFVDGISRIFVKGLKQLDICKRPIHCSDLKREIMYIKNDDNSWEKENDEKENLKNAIKQIADKNIKIIPEWKKANPECKDGESKKNDQYMNIINESMGTVSKEEDELKYNKIIAKVAKEVIIEK